MNPRRRWFRFTIREVLLLVALTAVACAWLQDHARAKRRLMAAKQQLDAMEKQYHEQRMLTHSAYEQMEVERVQNAEKLRYFLTPIHQR